MLNNIYNIAWIVNDYLNNLLLFITFICIFPKSKNKSNYFLSLFISILFVSLDIFNSNHQGLNSLIIIITSAICIKFDYTLVGKLIGWTFSFFLITFTQGLASNAILTVFPTLSDPKTSIQSVCLFTILTVLNYTFSFLIVFLLKYINIKSHIFTFLEAPLIQRAILLSLIILNVSYIMLYNITNRLKVEQSYIKLTLVIITVAIIFMTIGISLLVYSQVKEIKTKLNLEQIKERNSYINELEKNNNELRNFKHDYKNLLLSLSASINNNDNEDLKSSIYKLLHYKRVNLDSNRNRTNLYGINDKLVKGILVSKLMLAKSKEIMTDFEIDDNVKIPSKYSVDITRILGILLDNAIDACLETDHPELSFALISFDGYSEFIIKNNIVSADSININNIYISGYSTKRNHSGLGLASVREIVNSNDDLFLQNKVKNDHYSTTLIVLEEK